MKANHAMPRYEQVKSYILQLINGGKLKPHDRLPSENELVQTLDISRATVNRALRELSDGGYVTRLVGVGTFVSDSRPHSDLLHVRNIADEIKARGHIHSAEVITLEEVEASRGLAERLELRPGSRVFHSLIRHFESGNPIQLEDRYVRPELAPDYLKMDFTTITPNVYLTRVAPLHIAEHTILTAMPSVAVKRYLRMAKNEPCLIIRRRTWSGGRPVSCAELSHPGFTYELTGTLPENRMGG